MVRKQNGKWFEDENIQRITVKEKKYILEKKENANLVIPIEKIKRHNWFVKRKNSARAAKLQSKKVLNTK